MDIDFPSRDDVSGSRDVVQEDRKCVSRSRDVVDGFGNGDSEDGSDRFERRDGVQEAGDVVPESRDGVSVRRVGN